MEITSKFDIGDEVWHVFSRTRQRIEKCSVCQGAGQVPIVGVGELIKCPKCWGKGEIESGDRYQDHVVSHSSLTIGQVQITVAGPIRGEPGYESWEPDHHNMGRQSYRREERYMCSQTGVGSGTLYQADDLFPTKEEAEAEARARTSASVDRIVDYETVDA